MVGQLSLEDRFDDLLADLPHESVEVVQGFEASLIEELFQLPPVQSHRYLLELYCPFKEVYTAFSYSPAKTMTNNLPILSVLGGVHFIFIE